MTASEQSLSGMIPYIPAGILGMGKYVPETIVTNNDIQNMGLETSDEWIESRTGIKERRILDKDKPNSYMAERAALQAIQNAKIDKSEIDLIIAATTSSDYLGFPSLACVVQNKLGLDNIGAMDVAAACTGFSYVLTMASQFIRTGMYKKILIVASDCLSRYVDWTDRSICVLFGDGAGAAIVGQVEKEFDIVASQLSSSGAFGDILCINGGGSKSPFDEERLETKDHFIHMEGRSVFKVAISKIIPTIEHLCEQANIKVEEVDQFIFHQANMRLIDAACAKLNIPEHKVFCNIQKYGNTSAASIPIALVEAVELGRVKKHDTVLTLGFGAGFTWGGNIFKWRGEA